MRDDDLGCYLDQAAEPVEPSADDLALGTAIEDLAENQLLQLEGLEQSDELGVLISAAAERMVQIAISQIGVAEPAGGPDNTGTPLARYVRWFNPTSGPQAWCAFFASYCWDRATDSNHQVPWSPGSTALVYDWARRNTRLVSRPQRGDFYVYADFRHMGIVEYVSTGTAFRSIDGNWSNRVTRVNRTLGASYRYIRVS